MSIVGHFRARQQRGIGLLELLLALVLIVIIVLATLRYFETAERSRAVNSDIQTVQVVVAAANSWWQNNGHDFKGITFDKLSKSAYVSSNYKHNAWHGAVTVGAKGQLAKVTLEGIEAKACLRLAANFGLKEADACSDDINKTKAFSICTGPNQQFASCS